jgi:hypothetical protein
MLRMATSPIEGQQNKVCRPGWQRAAPGTAIKNARVWVVGPNRNNLLDTGLLLYEADAVSNSLCRGLHHVIPHIRQGLWRG